MIFAKHFYITFVDIVCHESKNCIQEPCIREKVYLEKRNYLILNKMFLEKFLEKIFLINSKKVILL